MPQEIVIRLQVKSDMTIGWKMSEKSRKSLKNRIVDNKYNIHLIVIQFPINNFEYFWGYFEEISFAIDFDVSENFLSFHLCIL